MPWIDPANPVASGARAASGSRASPASSGRSPGGRRPPRPRPSPLKSRRRRCRPRAVTRRTRRTGRPRATTATVAATSRCAACPASTLALRRPFPSPPHRTPALRRQSTLISLLFPFADMYHDRGLWASESMVHKTAGGPRSYPGRDGLSCPVDTRMIFQVQQASRRLGLGGMGMDGMAGHHAKCPDAPTGGCSPRSGCTVRYSRMGEMPPEEVSGRCFRPRGYGEGGPSRYPSSRHSLHTFGAPSS